MLTEEQLANLIVTASFPATTLASEAEVPLRELKRLTELSAYSELKRRRMSMKSIAGRLGISVPKVSLLSKGLKAYFSRPTESYTLERRVVTMLRGGPETVLRLTRDAGPEVDETDMRDVLAALVEQGVVEEVRGRTTRYQICSASYRRALPPWVARVDALRDMMGAVTDVIRARFVEADERAFARTVAVRVKPEALERLRTLYETEVFPLLVELDQAAADDPAADDVAIRLSIFWAPDSDAEQTYKEEET